MLLLGALAAGCGGGDGASREEFAEQADAICAEQERKIAAIAIQPRTLADVEAYSRLVRPHAQEQVRRLRELEAPEGDREAVERLLASFEELVRKLEQLEKAAARRDEAAARELFSESAAPNRAAAESAKALGLEVCAAPG